MGCSCCGRCEADVATLNDLVERGRTAYQKTSATFFRSGIFVTMLGTIFGLVGWMGIRGGSRAPWSYFLLLMGLIFAGWGISHFVSARKMSQK